MTQSLVKYLRSGMQSTNMDFTFNNPRTEETVVAFMKAGTDDLLISATSKLVPNNVNQDYTLAWKQLVQKEREEIIYKEGFIDFRDLVTVQNIFQQYGR